MPTVLATARGKALRHVPWIVVGVAALILAPVVAFAWDGYRVHSIVEHLEASATGAQRAFQDRDAAALTGHVDDLQIAATEFANHTSGWHWALSTKVPWVNSQTLPLHQVGVSLLAVANDALAPLAEAGDLTALEAPPFDDGRIDPFVLEDFRDSLAQATEVLASETADLDALDTSRTLPQIAESLEELRAEVADMGQVLHSAHVTAELLPSMLGGHGERTYALMVQNNAEPRASGGIPGAVLEITAHDGRIELGRYVPAAMMSDPEDMAAPLTADEERIFSTKMAQYAQNVNFTPEFPRAAAVMSAFWERETGEQVDGVVSIDPVAMGYLLDGMQPVVVDGFTLTSNNLAEVLESEVYWAYPDPRDSDAFFARAASVLFDQLLSGHTAAVEGIQRAIGEHRFALWSAHETEQSLLDSVVVGQQRIGQFDTAGIYLNDANAAKIGYYINQEIAVVHDVCESDGEVRTEVVVTLTHSFDGDVDALPDYVSGGGAVVQPGRFAADVLMYPRAGDQVSSVAVDGDPWPFTPDVHHGRSIVKLRVGLDPGQSVTIRFVSRSRSGDWGDELAWTPLARSTVTTRTSDVSHTGC